MFKGKHIRRTVGILGVLVILIPLSGLPLFWKNTALIILGILTVLTVTHRAIILEAFRLQKAFQAKRAMRKGVSFDEQKESNENENG